MPAKKKNFEEELQRLSQIVEQVESGQTPLDEAIKLYKEGLTLAAKCGASLTAYEEEVATLQKNAEGAFDLV